MAAVEEDIEAHVNNSYAPWNYFTRSGQLLALLLCFCMPLSSVLADEWLSLLNIRLR